jgi:DNA helicase-2/ATP-dependent DNA helicase PcrA
MIITRYEDIVTHFDSPTIVLAAPGTGKTYLLAKRIKYLLDHGTDKNAITALTFSVDADRQMKSKLTDPKEPFKIAYTDLPNISTMHSLGLIIVKEKPRDVGLRNKDLEVLDDKHVKELLYRDAALILGSEEEIGKEALDCKQKGDCTESPEIMKCKICSKYRELMSKCNYIDFDDQIIFACTILEDNPEILLKYQTQTKHLLVDEYQDINAAQFRFIKLLSRESRNGLFVVGDDAQSIYGFRGSSPKFIIDFTSAFPSAAQGILKISRRCHKNIMEDSFKILDKYYLEWSGKPELTYVQEDGDIPNIWQLSSESAEAKHTAWIARESILADKSVLILVPKKDFVSLIIKELIVCGVSYDCAESFLPKRIDVINRLFSWINACDDNFRTRSVIEDLINNGIAKVSGAKKDSRCTADTIRKRIDAETNVARLWESVENRHSLFSAIKSLDTPASTLTQVRDSLLSILDLYSNYRGDKRGEFLKQLSIITGIWIKPEQLEEDLTSVMALLQPKHITYPRLAKLRTLRKAKGLEADVVIIVGLENDIIPDPRASDEIEEARLFYVSMTRAKQSLYLFHSCRRPRNISYGEALIDKARSVFIDVIGRASEFKRA